MQVHDSEVVGGVRVARPVGPGEVVGRLLQVTLVALGVPAYCGYGVRIVLRSKMSM